MRDDNLLKAVVVLATALASELAAADEELKHRLTTTIRLLMVRIAHVLFACLLEGQMTGGGGSSHTRPVSRAPGEARRADAAAMARPPRRA